MNAEKGGQAVAEALDLGRNEITGAQVLAEMLQDYGVTHMFMVPAILRRTLLEIEKRTKIKVIRTHGEKSAAYMADGYARASGRPGVCGAQVIGALNIAAGLRDAWLAHSPVIAFTGGRDPKTKFKKAYQEVDDVPSFEPVTKFNATVDAVERFPDMLRQAFRVAVSGTPGPVHLQFRGNEGQIDSESAAMQPLCEDLYTHVPPFRPEPELSSILAALELLQKAERPLIVAGGGVRWSGAQKEVVALAEALGIPVATSLNGKGTIPGCHPLSVGVMGTYSRESANRVVQQADLIFYVGSEAGGMTTHFWSRAGGRRSNHSGRHQSRGTRPHLSAEGGDLRGRESDHAAHARTRGPLHCQSASGLERDHPLDLPRMVRKIPAIPRIECRADSSRAYLP